jgi:hypothetical protein
MATLNYVHLIWQSLVKNALNIVKLVMSGRAFTASNVTQILLFRRINYLAPAHKQSSDSFVPAFLLGARLQNLTKSLSRFHVKVAISQKNLH